MRDVTMAAEGDSLIFKHDAGVSSTVMNAKLMRWVFLFTHLNPGLMAIEGLFPHCLLLPVLSEMK